MGGEREIQVVMVKAVECLRVEANLFNNGSPGGEQQAVHRLNAAGRAAGNSEDAHDETLPRMDLGDLAKM